VDLGHTDDCVTPAAGDSARGGHGADTREVSAAEQRQIDARTAKLVAAKRARGLGPKVGKLAAASVPVYVHVMRSKSGAGDVTDQQIAQQIAVLNTNFAGRSRPRPPTPASHSPWPEHTATTTTSGTRTSRARPTGRTPARAGRTR
jgi:hypothetical protein